MSAEGSLVIIGGTSEMAKAVARRYVDEGTEIWLSSRDVQRAEAAAAELGGNAKGFALDLTDLAGIGPALAGIGPVSRLVIVAIERDNNTIADFNIAGASNLVTLKLLGYPEVIHALHDRLTEDASIVLYGGLAKEKPYPGGTMVGTVNGGISTLVHSLTLELAPRRVNAIHPAIVGDSPFWAAKPDEVLEGFRSKTPTGRLVTMEEIADATYFLLENGGMNGSNLNVDGGWLRT